MAKSQNGTYQGLLQWGADRYKIQSNNPYVELQNQLNYLKQTKDNTTDRKSWTDGGKGSGYKTGQQAYNAFTNNKSTLPQVHRAFSYGYVRPLGKEDSYQNRLKVVNQVYPRIINAKDSVTLGLLPKQAIGL